MRPTRREKILKKPDRLPDLDPVPTPRRAGLRAPSPVQQLVFGMVEPPHASIIAFEGATTVDNAMTPA
jgi:hypothetical protein